MKTPSIPITLIGKEIFDTIGLLDSGADISAMPKEIAEILGLELDGKVDYAYGIGGRVRSTQTNINLVLHKGHERYTFNLPIKVILDDYDFPLLLGRTGFFDRFIVIFDENQERVQLKRRR